MIRSIAKLMVIWIVAGLIPGTLLALALMTSSGHVGIAGLFFIFTTMCGAWGLLAGIAFTLLSFGFRFVAARALWRWSVCGGMVAGTVGIFAMDWNLEVNGLFLFCGAAYGSLVGFACTGDWPKKERVEIMR